VSLCVHQPTTSCFQPPKCKFFAQLHSAFSALLLLIRQQADPCPLDGDVAYLGSDIEVECYRSGKLCIGCCRVDMDWKTATVGVVEVSDIGVVRKQCAHCDFNAMHCIARSVTECIALQLR
jgi:hypothetical protein